MPFTDKTKQQEYIKKYIGPYMRTYRKHKVTVDCLALGEMKKQYPDAFKLLLSKMTARMRSKIENELEKQVESALQKESPEICEENSGLADNKKNRGTIPMSYFETEKPELARQLLAGEDFVIGGDYVYSISPTELCKGKPVTTVRFARKAEIIKEINRFFH
jgi:hypothetical protein